MLGTVKHIAVSVVIIIRTGVESFLVKYGWNGTLSIEAFCPIGLEDPVW